MFKKKFEFSGTFSTEDNEDSCIIFFFSFIWRKFFQNISLFFKWWKYRDSACLFYYFPDNSCRISWEVKIIFLYNNAYIVERLSVLCFHYILISFQHLILLKLTFVEVLFKLLELMRNILFLVVSPSSYIVKKSAFEQSHFLLLSIEVRYKTLI